MRILSKAYKADGVVFKGEPKYIHYDSYLDALGGLIIGHGVVISTKVIILSHDFSYNIGLIAINQVNEKDICILDQVIIGENVFIGAGAVILPGSVIGECTVIGAGAIVKGVIPSYSIVVGNPSKIVGNTKDWGANFFSKFKIENIHYSK